MEIIDLTHTIEEGITTFATHWHPVVEINQVGRLHQEGRETCKISLGSHTGTHIDAPSHFIAGANGVDKIPLDKLYGSVKIIDFSHLPKAYGISAQDLEKFELQEKMIFRFDWCKYWCTKDFYNNYPYLTEDAAQYLVSKNVKLLGIDTPSPDNSNIKLNSDNIGTETDSPVHKILLSNNIILVEYLANLNQADLSHNWKIVVMPLKIKNADGSPARVCIIRD